jgi:hypothetical protein
MGGGGKGGSSEPEYMPAYRAALAAEDSARQMAESKKMVDSISTDNAKLVQQITEASNKKSEDSAAQYKQQLADQERLAGVAKRDSLYSDYMTAASKATDYVNSEIQNEQANAKLFGLGYNVTDEQKTTRIQDYFSTIWGEGDHKALLSSMQTWGNPEGFTALPLERGTGKTYEVKPAKVETIATSQGMTPAPKPTLLTDEQTLSKSSTLSR